MLMLTLIGLISIVLFRNQLISVVWKIFYANLSDEKLEQVVRKEYETYESDRSAYNEEGLTWLLQMAQHLQIVWKHKQFSGVGHSLKSHFDKNQVLSYWKNAEENLISEINRRKYFNALT